MILDGSEMYVNRSELRDIMKLYGSGGKMCGINNLNYYYDRYDDDILEYFARNDSLVCLL
jgi:hypothetical protein